MAKPSHLSNKVSDEEWESDDEFEQSVIELDQSINSKCDNLKPSLSTSDVIVTKKIHQLQPAKSSTPLPATVTQLRSEEKNCDKYENNNKRKNKPAGTYFSKNIEDKSKEQPSCFAEPSPITVVSTKRKRKFPGPAGTLPKLVSCLINPYHTLMYHFGVFAQQVSSGLFIESRR